MKRINFKNVVWKEGRYYVAWNLNTGISSFGETRKEALESLKEALSLYLEDIKESISKVERPDIISLTLNYA